VFKLHEGYDTSRQKAAHSILKLNVKAEGVPLCHSVEGQNSNVLRHSNLWMDVSPNLTI